MNTERKAINPFVDLPHPAFDSINGAAHSLVYDVSLLTAQEQKAIEEAWDGDAILSDDWLADNQEIVVAVHNGEAHGDDVGCVALMRVLLRDHQVRVIRTRRPDQLEVADLRFDVGEGLLDHHGARADREHGVAAITRVFQLLLNSLGDMYPRLVWERLANVCDQISLADCGLIDFSVTPWVNAAGSANRARPGYGCGGDGENASEDALFGRLVYRMTEYFEDVFQGAVGAHNALEAANADIEAAGQDCVVVFSSDARLAPCKEMLHTMKHPAWYYVSPESPLDWRVLCCADPNLPFSQKGSWHLIPEKYAGLRDGDLDKATGFAKGTGIFVHKDRFIGGFKSMEDAVKFARKCAEEGGWKK